MILRKVLLAVLVWGCAVPLYADTVEFVTYYPSPGDTASGEDTHLPWLAVGTEYDAAQPADGEGLFFSSVGIGPGFGAASPSNRLEVVSTEPGMDGISLTGLAPSLRLFEGTDTARGGLGAVNDANQFVNGTWPADVVLYSQEGDLVLAAPQGDVVMDHVVITPRDTPPPDPVEGMLYSNSIDHGLHYYSEGSWSRFVQFDNSPVGTRTLGSDYKVITSSSYRQPPDLLITQFTGRRGLYSMTWEGTVEMAADSESRTTLLQIGHSKEDGTGFVLVHQLTLRDDDENPLLPTVHDISGGAILFLGRRVRNFRIRARKTGNDTRNKSFLKAGAKINVDMLLPL